jgi:hypothetical protein
MGNTGARKRVRESNKEKPKRKSKSKAKVTSEYVIKFILFSQTT